MEAKVCSTLSRDCWTVSVAHGGHVHYGLAILLMELQLTGEGNGACTHTHVCGLMDHFKMQYL